jgi:hypothetical protein
MSVLSFRTLVAAALLFSAGTAYAAPDKSEPVGPTMGDIVRQASQPAPKATTPVPATNLPTMGDIVKQTESQAKAATAQHTAPEGCTRPKVPGDVPDGTKANEEEIRQAQLRVKAYVAESEEFNRCLDKLVQANYGRLTVRDYLSLTAQHDLTISAMQLFAERFNVQLRAFKARNAGGAAPAAKP